MAKQKSENSNKKTNRLTMAMENYLLSIIHLEEQGLPITPAGLANQFKRLPSGEGLGTSLPSVSGMIKRMMKEGLLRYSENKSISLTKSGRNSAESMIRRHRLAECMVVDLLGLDIHRAHEEAHRLEHAISPDLESKIAETLNHPNTCPFGHPIPGERYLIPIDLTRLSEVDEGTTFTIDRVPEDDQSLLSYLVDNKLLPGSIVSLEELAIYRGVIRLRCENNDVFIGQNVAGRIFVKDLSSNK